MRKQIHQNIFLNKGDLVMLKKEGLTIQTPDGNSVSLLWDGHKPHVNSDASVPREVVAGPVRAKIIEILTNDGPTMISEIAKRGGVKKKNMFSAIYYLKNKNLITKNEAGEWQLKKSGEKK